MGRMCTFCHLVELGCAVLVSETPSVVENTVTLQNWK